MHDNWLLLCMKTGGDEKGLEAGSRPFAASLLCRVFLGAWPLLSGPGHLTRMLGTTMLARWLRLLVGYKELLQEFIVQSGNSPQSLPSTALASGESRCRDVRRSKFLFA